MAASTGVVRLAAVSDIHYNKNSQGALQPLFAQITESADVLLGRLGVDPLAFRGAPDELVGVEGLDVALRLEQPGPQRRRVALA